MKKTIVYILFFTLFTLTSRSQNKENFELKFIHHLDRNHLYEDIIINQNYVKDYKFSLIQKDSINYFVGKANYYLNNFDTSIFFFNQIKLSKGLISKSNILIYNYYIDNKQFVSALKPLNKIVIKDKSKSLFYKMGLLLLSDNIVEYEKNMKNNKQKIYKLDLLTTTYNQRKLYKVKSPVVAGILSAIIPGMGRVYANKPIHGITSFIPIVWLGYTALEGYKHDGINSPNFYIFGSMFTIFYVGNIWGSVFTAKKRNEEKLIQINEELYNNIYIPFN